MPNKIKNEFEYKLIGILLYFFINLSGLSVLLIYYPRNLLFNENTDAEKIKLNLYKNFAKSIYDNINTPLIKNLTLTDDNASCPENFEKLISKNQYYGNFSKFYGNKSICIERFNSNEYSYINLLKIADYDTYKNDKKKCCKLTKDSDYYIYVSNKMMCPLNHIEINSKSRAKYFGNYYYQMAPGDQYLTPIYGNNPHNQAIINIEFINNYKVCLEKYMYSKDIPCEFPDNNECFIKDNYEQIYNLEHYDDDYNLYIKNLIKWNYPNMINITNFCNPTLKLHIFAIGYVSFTNDNYKQFEQEFPSNENNPLYKAYKAYKSPKNIDRFFCLISLIILLWSIIHFSLQIMVYINIKGARKVYIINGIVLFIFKLLSYFGIIINNFYFLNKIQKIYITMVDKPRNKILEYYSASRQLFIVKIIFIGLLGFIIISVDFIIYIFTYIMDWGVFFKHEDEKIIKKPEKPITAENGLYKITLIDEYPPPKIKNPFVKEEKEIDLKNREFISKRNNILGSSSFIDYSNEITLKFIFKDDITKSFIIKTEKDKSFNNALQKLKNEYSELKDKKMKVFITSDSNIINKNKTINENQISPNNNTIYIQ